jgi:hypothetical protein
MDNEEQDSPRGKIESLAKEFEGNPETEDLAVVLYVIAGSSMLGKEAVKSLAVWNATWADSVINEVNKIKEESAVEDLTNKIVNPDNE